MTQAHPVAPDCLAVVVSAGLTEYLAETLRALAEQRTAPEAVLIVDVSPLPEHPAERTTALRTLGRDAGLPLERVRVVAAPAAATLGHAVRDGLLRLGEQGGGGPELSASRWLWLLHDDSRPERGALAELLRVGEAGPSIALVGAKQRDWENPDRLVSVGFTVTPGGRRFTGIEDGELDQGQHDHRDDVYAVGTAGTLVRREVWDALGGPDPAVGPFGDGEDLSLRARLAGHRVVVAPRAVVNHARAAYFGLRPDPAGGVPDGDARLTRDPRRSFRARRTALLHLRLAQAPALAVLPLAVLALLAAPFRALFRVVTKDPGLAGDELAAAAGAALRPRDLARARRRARATRVLSPRRLAPLRASWRDSLGAWRDRRLQAAAAREARVAPNQLVEAERAALAARRRTGGTLALLVPAGLALAAFGALAGAEQLAGGALLPPPGDLGELWQRALSSWVPAGDGAPGPPDPLLPVLAVLAAPANGSAPAAVAALLLGSIPIASVGAWFAAGAATRTVRLRLLAALIWGLSPALLLATGQGRLGAVVAHAALPWAALGFARAAGVQRMDPPGTPRRDGAATVAAVSGAGLALAVAAAGAPILLPAGVVAVAAVAALAPRRRGALLLGAVPPLVLLAPLLLAAAADLPAGSWRVLFGAPGPAVAAAPPGPLDPLLGLPAAPEPWPYLPDPVAGLAPAAAGAVLVLLALLAFARRGRFRAALAGWIVAVVGLAAASGAGRVQVAVGSAPPGVGGSVLVPGWAGPGVSLALAGFLIAALVGADGIGARLAAHSFGWRQLGAGALGALLAVTTALGTAAWLREVALARAAGEPRSVLALVDRGSVVPALGLELQGTAQQARVLALESLGDELSVSLWRGDGALLTERSAVVAARELSGAPGQAEVAEPDDAAEELIDLAASLSLGTAGNPSEVLAGHAVAVVVVPPGEGDARDRLVAALDATAGLERVTENETGTVWRVAPPEGTALIGRVRVVSPDGTVTDVVPASGALARGPVEAGEPARSVVLAERADPGWRAWLDGEPLRASADGWRQAFELGAEGGVLVVAHTSWRLTLVHTAQAVVLALFVLLAIPVRRRRGGAS